jgi:glycosyltransferase involved in cell wall biosynthesis
LPVKNGGIFLQAAVGSILNQSFPSFELLLVDDHSTDGAIAALNCNDERLRILRSPAEGVVAAFNYGLSQAQGEFIARMDADDIALPIRLECQLAYLRSYPEIGIAGACVEIFSDGELDGGMAHYQQWLNAARTAEQIHQQIFIESPIPNPTAMFRSDLLRKLGAYRDLEWPEDYDLYLRADHAGIRMGKPDDILLKWREHSDRVTHNDARYSRLNFQRAKAHFLVNGRLPDIPLILWGAGPGGRQFYDLLLNEGREVCGFIDVHPRRIGGLKRGKPVWGMEQVDDWRDGFILVAVGSRGARPEIRSFLENTGREEARDFLFVA